jgi:hypothetical protein
MPIKVSPDVTVCVKNDGVGVGVMVGVAVEVGVGVRVNVAVEVGSGVGVALGPGSAPGCADSCGRIIQMAPTSEPRMATIKSDSRTVVSVDRQARPALGFTDSAAG